MKYLVISLTLILAACLSGCGSSCSPHDAYTVPAHWDHAYYSTEQVFDHWRYYRSCSHYYDSYSHRYRSSCSTNSVPVYYWVREYHAAVYHSAEYVPAVRCKASKQ